MVYSLTCVKKRKKDPFAVTMLWSPQTDLDEVQVSELNYCLISPR